MADAYPRARLAMPGHRSPSTGSLRSGPMRAGVAPSTATGSACARWSRPMPRRHPTTSATSCSTCCSTSTPPTTTGRCWPSGSTRPGRLPPVRLLDGLDQFALVHRAAAPDLEAAGQLHQVALGGVGVDALGGVPAPSRPSALARRLSIRRTLVSLGLPVVADLLVAVLEGGERRAMGPLALAVSLHRAVVRLLPDGLGVAVRALQRGGQVGGRALGHHGLLSRRRGAVTATRCGWPPPRRARPLSRRRRPRPRHPPRGA